MSITISEFGTRSRLCVESDGAGCFERIGFGGTQLARSGFSHGAPLRVRLWLRLQSERKWDLRSK